MDSVSSNEKPLIFVSYSSSRSEELRVRSQLVIQYWNYIGPRQGTRKPNTNFQTLGLPWPISYQSNVVLVKRKHKLEAKRAKSFKTSLSANPGLTALG